MVSEADLRARARGLKLVLTDVDGVLTDGGVYVSDGGEAMKRFSIRDGMGVARLREVGLDVGIITGENSAPVARRAEKLHIEELHLGIADKSATLDAILERRGLRPEEVAHIGDDVNDLPLLERVGLSAAPGDALPMVAERVHLVTRAVGGHGAFREFAEWIIAARTESETQKRT